MFAGHCLTWFDHQGVSHGDGFLIGRTGTAVEQERVPFCNIFALDEEFIERRVAPVDGLRGQHDLAVAG